MLPNSRQFRICSSALAALWLAVAATPGRAQVAVAAVDDRSGWVSFSSSGKPAAPKPAATNAGSVGNGGNGGSGGDGGWVNYQSPEQLKRGQVTGRRYNEDVLIQTVTYPGGSTREVSLRASGKESFWEKDHVTLVTVYHFDDGTTNRVSAKVPVITDAPRYEGNRQIVGLRYPDGTTGSVVNTAVDVEIAWLSDRRSRVKTYRFADGGSNKVSETVPPVRSKPVYQKDTQTTILTYGDGSSESVVRKAVRQKLAWEPDHVTRTTTYFFDDGTKNSESEVLPAKRGEPEYKDGLQRVTVSYPDGHRELLVSKPVSQGVIWADDHITKTVLLKFEDGSRHLEYVEVRPVQGKPRYKGDSQYIDTLYGDGTHTTQVNKAVKETIRWSPAKTEQTATYQFADGSQHEEVFILDANNQLKKVDDATGAAAGSFILQGFEFSGNQRLSREQLASALAAWKGKRVDFDSLKTMAAMVSNRYREAGMLARTELPEQEIVNGVVRLEVVEAKLSGVDTAAAPTGSRVEQLALKIVEQAHPVNAPVDLQKVDKAALLLSDIPGVQGGVVLQPGANPGDTRAVVDVAPMKGVEGAVAGDNGGARSTGSDRVIVQAKFNGYMERGDQFSLVASKSEGSEYARLGYSEPIGYGGWRLGASATAMNYQLVAQDFLAINAHGPSNSLRVEANGPLLRTKASNLSLQLGYEGRQFHNETYAGVVSSYSGQAFNMTMQGSATEENGGATTGSLGFVAGRIDLSGSPNQSYDAQTTRTAGYYGKLIGNLARQQPMAGGFSVSVRLQGQMASKNLDGSEKIYLGGPQGVRAYGVNEGAGSEGYIFGVDAMRQFPLGGAMFTMATFFDSGYTKINKNNDFAHAVSLNEYRLQGAGAWAGLTQSNRFGVASLKLTWARRIGLNPAANAQGLDQDGSLVKDRFWLEANQSF